MEKFDFGGYATRNDLLCGDGLTIRKNAFKDDHGKKVPLIWNHDHSDPEAVLGHAMLENRDDGVYARCKFNNSEKGQHAKELVHNGDVRSLSIWANQLKKLGSDVIHGTIRELSLVLAGANPGAFIDEVMAHGDDEDGGMIINYDENALTLYHSDMSEDEEVVEHSEKKEEENVSKDKTLKEIYDSMTEDQQECCAAMVGMALEDAGVEDEDDEEMEHSEGGENSMKSNVFDQNENVNQFTLSHSDEVSIVEMAKQPGVGSLQSAIKMFGDENDCIAHGLDLGDTEVLNELLPDHKLLNPGAPEIYGLPDQGWVMGVINKIKKTPYSRIRTRKADARQTELRAKGYKKGEEKKLQDHIKLLGRKTEPTTVYIKDQLHRDDIIDITDFSVVEYIWNMMKGTMYETLALAALVGDGRDDADPDKISEENIRPIWKDEELYTIHRLVDFTAAKAKLQGTNTSANFGENYIYAEAMVEACLYSREKFKGSGSPVLYCAPHFVNMMLLARDLNGRRIYDSKADLAKALNVSGIVEIEQFDGKTRTDANGKTRKLLGLIVNLGDYQFGSTKGGEITKFSDFDIDFNKYTYLMETRLSGALTEPESAIALEELVGEEVAG